MRVGRQVISWEGADADDEVLSYGLWLSDDGGATWQPLALDLSETTYTVDTTAFPPGSDYLIKVRATDGVNTAVDQSEAPFAVLETPVSPELVPPGRDGRIEQRTEDLVGPYELHDFFLFCLLRFGAGPRKILFLAEHAFAGRHDAAALRRWLVVFLRRFFAQQWKRSVMPDGPKVGSVSLSPRGDWRMPSDADVSSWLAELEDGRG